MKFYNKLITWLSYLRQPKKRALISEASRLRNLNGIEIGGPSAFFSLKSSFPAYVFANNIDGVNFSNETIWEGSIKEGLNYNYFNKHLGYQYIAEATDLSMIPGDRYDFLLSCHSLEHVANPVKAIKEWNRILKIKGKFILVLPDKRNTFDINRPYTLFEHLINDYNANVDEYDETHFDEIIRYHDHSKDSGDSSKEDVSLRLKDNFKNRMAHHHVFSQDLVSQLMEYCGFRVLSQHDAQPFHLITISEKI